MSRILKKKSNNSGNTFVVIMVSIACMSILVAVILASIGYYYRMCKMNLNDKNNFYYLEKAMDEIYTGIGNDSVAHLMTAYSDTVEVMVRYDATKGEYVTINESEANSIMKQKFLNEIANDDNYKNQEDLKAHIASFLSDETKAANVELITPTDLSKPRLYVEIVTSTQGTPPNQTVVYDKIIIHNITVKRTVTGDSNANNNGFVQSITTDIVISEPDFAVSFSNADGLDSPLYDFSMIADRGVEFDFRNSLPTNGNEVSIKGNIYAAADFYNKSYSDIADGTEANNNPCDGSVDSSLYSGLYTDGGKVSIRADKVIVPGTIAVMNDSSVSISGLADSTLLIGDDPMTTQLADIWADNIVMAPSSERVSGLNTDNGNLTMYANAYIADDMEINSDEATVTMAGNYYGYNYSQNTNSQKLNNSSYYDKLSDYSNSSLFGGGKSHFNSSAIIINGMSANLNFEYVQQLHVAGRAYIETSREKIITADTENNRSVTTYIPAGETNGAGNFEAYQDIQTGESISIKSNQLAYVASGVYTHDEVVDSTMVGFPKFTGSETLDSVIRDNIDGWLDPNNKVVTCTISGHTYTFLNFASAEASKNFFDWYANTLPTISVLKNAKLVNVSTYENFKLTNISVEDEAKYKTTITTSGTATTGSLGVTNSELTVSGGDMSSTAMTNFAAIANARNADYKELRYQLVTIDSETCVDETLKSEKQAEEAVIAAMDFAEITPIHRYLDFSKITDTKHHEIATYQVWISKGDVHVPASAADSNGIVKGMIIAKGDVTFDSGVTCFEGLIVTGSKIKVNHEMQFVSNKNIVKTILATAESSSDCKYICEIFKDYVEASAGNDSDNVPVGNIEVGDVLLYENWKKNAE